MHELLRKSISTLRDEGIWLFCQKTFLFLKKKLLHLKAREVYADVLFVNGCPLPHPYRYRVQHQREQLAMVGISSDEVYYTDIRPEILHRFRSVIIYRCPITPDIEQFIQRAQYFNKYVIFDLDDLVIDTKYTDQIPYVRAMSVAEKQLYDDGVNRYRATMQMCDAVVTTTTALAKELRDYMPEVFINRNTASDTMVALSDKAVLAQKRSPDELVLGYFSGSITHNDDFAMILPVLLELFEQYSQIRLLVVGELSLPEELIPYKDRVRVRKFVDWTLLPAIIAEADINLVPLIDTIFNAAKSENKWVEAALVGVPTVASNIGAFQEMISSGETGILCDSIAEWKAALSDLIEHAELREQIASRAREHVLQHCVTSETGMGLRDFILAHRQPNLAMLLPSFNVSGGILVALKHCDILRQHGYDVAVINLDETPQAAMDIQYDSAEFASFIGNKVVFETGFDRVVTTMWLTNKFLSWIPVKKAYYLVQNFETGFYPRGTIERMEANSTYCNEDIQYVTISRWCQEWLKDKFRQTAKYAPNGLERERFNNLERSWDGKIRILIEGDSESKYKNVDESFHIVEQLPSEQFEVWYVSYNGAAKKWYRVDRFFHKVPYEEMPELYRQCHILLKTSVLESFSYPPLEMMATGGMVVVRENGGNREYLRDGLNCLFYDPEDLSTAVRAIERICSEPDLRASLWAGGQQTADCRDWKNCETDVLNLYAES